QADAAALDAAARLLSTRLAAAGFTGSTVHVDDDGLLVTLAAAPGREELVERLGAPGQLQPRPAVGAAHPPPPPPPPARRPARGGACARQGPARRRPPR